MGNANWLIVALPSWYLEAALHPFSAGAFTLIPAVGLLLLLLGAILGIRRRCRGLSWFLLLFALSEALVGIAGAMRGEVHPSGTDSLLNIQYAFLALQLIGAAYLIYRLKGARLSALAIGLFTVTYAVAATFVAGMSFTDTWL